MDEADTYTIAEFCVRNRICRAYYYKLRPLRLAPAEMRLGSKILISKEAAAVWRRKMETANSKPLAADAAACFNETERLDGVCRRANQPPVRQNVRGAPKHPERERRRPMSPAGDGSTTQKRSRYRKIEPGQASLREYVPERVSTVVIVSVKLRGRDEINSQANQIVI